MKDGTYTYRFDGASMANNTPWHLVGLGQMKVTKGRITGLHRSSILPLKGQDAALTHTAFRLAGKVKTAGPFLTATLTFTCTSADSNGETLDITQTLTGTFDFVASGKDRYWIISSGAYNETLKSWAAEAVAGEVVRLAG